MRLREGGKEGGGSHRGSRPWQMASDWLHRTSLHLDALLALIWCSWQKPRCGGGGGGGGGLSLRNHTLPIILLIPQFVSAQCLKKEDFLLDPNAHRHRNRLIYRVGPSLERRRRARVTDQRKGPPTPPSREQEAKVGRPEGRYTTHTAYCARVPCPPDAPTE